jgi:hypothetical protein
MSENTHGGKRRFSGRLPKSARVGVENRRLAYEEEYPDLSAEEIKKKLKVDALKLQRKDWFEYIDSDQYGNFDGTGRAKDEFEKLLEEGKTYEEISEIMNFPNMDAAWAYAKSVGVKKKYGGVDDVDVEKALDMLDEGISKNKIAKAFGVSVPTLAKAIGRAKDDRLKDWVTILSNGSVFVVKTSRGTERSMITHDGQQYSLSRVIWNASHPEDIIKPGEVIHHIDEDPLNDDISNLQKITFGEHKRLHALNRVRRTLLNGKVD